LLRSLEWLPLHWIVFTPCPLCRRAVDRHQHGLARREALCEACRLRLQLPNGGLSGLSPLAWWSAGAYSGALRRQLLTLRREPRAEVIDVLLGGLRAELSRWRQKPLLVPIPSWKRNGNPLPPLVCRQLGRGLGLQRQDLLERSHPVLGQHHLNRRMRLANQQGAFRCRRPPLPGQAATTPLLLVDDILTTGATACSAAGTLRQAGWRVVGLLCLARTPAGGTGDPGPRQGAPQTVIYNPPVAPATGRDSSVGRAGD
jgi:predicted amidophosphoribosyltransferase